MESLVGWSGRLLTSWRIACEQEAVPRRISLAISWLVLLGTLATATWAFATNYVYDADGRLVIVTDDGNQSAHYVYDAMGNLTAIERFGANGLAIFSFSPSRGAPGAQVRVQGHGFSPNPSDNALSFNGATAAVIAATGNEIIATVPAAATTGPVSVTVDGNTATSSADFTVIDSLRPPVIHMVSPLVGAVGSAVTVAGEWLNPVVGQTSVRLNVKAAIPNSVTNTEVVFPIPANTGSGRVIISTPFGVATSVQDLLVAPLGIDPAKIVQIKRLVPDAMGESFATGVPGEYAAVLFDGAAGDFITAQFSSISSDLTYALYGSDNKEISSGSVDSSSMSIHMPGLEASATYLLLIRSTYAQAQWDMMLEKDKEVHPSGDIFPVVTTVPAQSKRFLVGLEAGGWFNLKVENMSTPGSSGRITFNVYRPDGVTINDGASCRASDACWIDSYYSMAGSRSIVATAPIDGARTMEFAVQVIPAKIGTIDIDAPTQQFHTEIPGQAVHLFFTAQGGENLGLAARRINEMASSPFVLIYQVNSDLISTQWNCWIYTQGCSLNLNLNDGGVYGIVVRPDPDYRDTTISFSMVLSSDVHIPMSLDVKEQIEIENDGQNGRLTFQGVEGDTLAIVVSGISTVPEGGSVACSVYKPDGTFLHSMSVSSVFRKGLLLNLPNLPLTGTYTVLVEPSVPTVAQFEISSGSGLNLDAVPAVFSSSAQGEHAYFTFSASEGQNYGFGISELMTPDATSPIRVEAYRPDGSLLTFTESHCRAQFEGCQMRLANLPAGIYSLMARWPAEGNQIMSFRATLSSDITASLIPDEPFELSIDRNGQSARLTFTAEIGETLAISVADQHLVPSLEAVSYAISGPDDAFLTEFSILAPRAGFITNLSNLVVMGTYSVLVTPRIGQIAHTKVIVDTGHPIQIDGGPVSFSSILPGRSAYFKFDPASGSDLVLNVQGVEIVGEASNPHAIVYGPSGTFLASCEIQGASCSLELDNSAAGMHAVIVSAYGDYEMDLSIRIDTR